MHIPATWHKVDVPFAPWFIPYQTAEIRHNDTVIGYAGLSHPLFFKNIAPGSAFMFELDGDFLTQYQPDTVRMQPLCKFPDIVRDISLLVPMTMTVVALKDIIHHCDKRIISVEIQDFFEKPEWQTHRSVTFRYTLRDYQKTMTKVESDEVHITLVKKLSNYDVQVR